VPRLRRNRGNGRGWRDDKFAASENRDARASGHGIARYCRAADGAVGHYGRYHLVWKNLNPVATDVGLPVSANTTFATCPAELDVLFVPGGLKGSVALLQDQEVLAFLADRSARARYVTSYPGCRCRPSTDLR